MPGGRRPGSKNPPGHRAGGDRRGPKFKARKRKAEEEKARWKQNNFERLMRKHQETSTPISVEHPLSDSNFSASQKLLAEVLDHPSMPKGKRVPTAGLISEDGKINYPNEASPVATPHGDNKKHRRQFMPDKGTPLRTFLDKAASDIKKSDSWRRRKYYYQKLESPLTYGLGCMPTPEKFYLPDLVRIWWPKHQFHSIDFEYKCPQCKSESVESNGIRWRPAFEHNEIRWIFCHEIKCTNTKCNGHTFNTTDPAFLSMLPSCIADLFEFVFPPSGPGVSRTMLRRLSLQIDNHVLHGAWVQEVNDMMWENYFQKCNQYYELLNIWLERWPSVIDFDGTPPMHASGYDGRPMVPYSAFGEPGHHNGIMMTEGLAKTLFRLVEGGKRFEYNQNSFGVWHDEGLRADDTFKICKKVFVTTAGRQRVRPWPGLYTILSQSGKIVAAVPKMSMSHDMNRKILEELKVARDHVGAPPLRLLQTDNPGGEQAPYYEVFPELQQGIMPAGTTLPTIQLPSDDIAFFHSGSALSDYILTFAHLFPDTNETIYYGLDTEFERDATLTVLSLAFPRSMSSANGLDEKDDRIPAAIVIHLHKIGRTSFPESLRHLLQQPNMIPVGCRIGGDCSKLEDQYGIIIKNRIELQSLCDHDRDLSSYGLESLMEEYLNCTYPMNKSAAQRSSYAKQQLTEADKQYCALDASVSLWVFQGAISSLKRQEESIGLTRDPHPTFEVGKRCIVLNNRKEIAVGTLGFVGSRGQMRRWGSRRIGRSECLVTIESIIDGNFKPAQGKRHSSWPDSAETLRDILDDKSVMPKEVVVTFNQVRILPKQEDSGLLTEPDQWDLAVQSSEADRKYVDRLLGDAKIVVSDELSEGEAAATNGATPTNKSAERRLLIEETQPITKSLKDIFHQLHCIPLSKDAEEIAEVLSLVLVATWIYDEEDYTNVVEVLQSKGVGDLFLHEFFNREYWRKRVKRHTPLPLDHATNIQMVKDEIWNTPGFEKIRTKELETWFETFAKNAEDGLYYIPKDIQMYRVDRVDCDGLTIYVTDFGTNLNESLHQKFADLVGPFSVGAETADLLLVLRSFRFNIAVGILRCGEPDFNTDRHDIVDKTQHWMMQVFATYAWPTHKNLLDFDPPKTAALVGIRPLPLNPNHVKYAETPDAALSQDHKYLSKKMGLAIAPLPLSTKEEFQLYTAELRKLVATGKTPRTNDWDTLAREFLRLTDATTIFPKTEDQLKKYYTHWKRNRSKQLFSKRVNIARSKTYRRLRKQNTTGAVVEVMETSLPSKVDNCFYSSKRPLEEKPAVVPPAAAYNQSHHVGLRSKRPRRSRPKKKEPLTFQKLKQKPPDELGSCGNRCAWYPVCLHQVWKCGGRSRTMCKFINKEHGNGLSQVEIEKRINFVKAQKQQEETRRKQRERAIKKKTKAVENKNRRAPHLTTQPKQQQEVITIDDDIADDQYLSQQSVTVPSAQNSKEGSDGTIIPARCLKALAARTSMIDDEVVNAYLGLLTNKCHSSRTRIGVGATLSGFIALLKSPQFGWEGAQRHLDKDHQINLIPAFFGPRSGLHWAAVIIDSTLSSGSRKFLYFDSMSYMRQGGFRSVKEWFQDWEAECSNFIMMDWPDQAVGSNDCAVFTLAACAYYVLRAGNFFPSSCEFSRGMNAAKFGRGWRRHVYKSIINARMDLTDDVFGWMVLKE